MSLLTQEELDKLSGAEQLFPSPIPVQFVGLYEKHGGDRTNLAYGYINKG